MSTFSLSCGCLFSQMCIHVVYVCVCTHVFMLYMCVCEYTPKNIFLTVMIEQFESHWVS